MGQDIFGIDIAGIIDDTFDGKLALVGLKRTPGSARDPGNLTGGPVAGPPIVGTCNGFFDDFTGTPPPGVELQLGDRRAVLIGDSIPAAFLPFLANDEITIEGVTLYNVKVLSRDPAAAVFTLLCRDRRGPAAS